MGQQRIILHVDMDCFFAAIEESLNHELNGKPVIIGADPIFGKGRGVVSTANYRAREFGIHSAMPISTAYRLCKDGIFVKPRYHLYSQTSKKIMILLRKYSNRFQQVGIDEAYLDITENALNFEEASILGNKIKNEIFEKFSLTCSIGIANNKSVAKIASDTNKPNGLTLVQNNREFLTPLPIRKISGIGKKTEPKLKEIGINTIGDLTNYSKEKLMQRFGVYGLYLNLAAQGEGSDFVGYEHERSSISKERTFFEDTTDFNKINELIEKIAEDIHETLLEEHFVFKTVSIKIRMHNFETFTRSITLNNFHIDKKIIIKCAIGLAKEFNGKKIRLIGVRVSQLELFEGQTTLSAFVH